jgi:hypothetical protein
LRIIKLIQRLYSFKPDIDFIESEDEISCSENNNELTKRKKRRRGKKTNREEKYGIGVVDKIEFSNYSQYIPLLRKEVELYTLKIKQLLQKNKIKIRFGTIPFGEKREGINRGLGGINIKNIIEKKDDGSVKNTQISRVNSDCRNNSQRAVSKFPHIHSNIIKRKRKITIARDDDDSLNETENNNLNESNNTNRKIELEDEVDNNDNQKNTFEVENRNCEYKNNERKISRRNEEDNSEDIEKDVDEEEEDENNNICNSQNSDGDD